MIGRLARLPLRVLAKVRELVSPKSAPPPAAAPRPRPRPAPPPEEDEEPSGGHDHGHSHSHGHSHDHGRAPAPVAPPPPPPAPAPEEADHGHSHSHGHSHDHGGGGRALSVTPEQTPNPNAMKFTIGRKLAGKGSFTFNSAAEAASHPVGRALFEVPGVKSVFGVNNFVTITKDEDASWDRLIAGVTDALKATA